MHVQSCCLLMCSSKNENSEGRGGGGVQKEVISEGVGAAFRGLFPGASSKIGELRKTNSCSIC